MASIQEIYPLTNNGAILEAFFKDMASSRKSGGKGAISRAGGNNSITSKIWSEIEMLNNSDQTAFFTVAFHHPALHVVLPDCFEAAARSIVSSTKADRIPKAAIQALTEIAIKIITGFDPANIPNNTSSSRNGNGSSAVDMISYCQRLQKLFPPSSWMSLAHVLYRQSPSVATIVLNALLMHVPGDLPSLKAIAMTWCDNVGILYDKCVGEAKRGRFMRTNGDILVLFESAFRLSHELWCLLEAAPIAIAPYLPLDHILDSLSDLTNKISPLLQYFVLHSDDLVSSRKRLSRANALIVNASIRSSVIAMLFTPFIRGSAEESAVSISKGTGYANPRPVQALDESVTSQLLESLPPSSVPSRLLKKCGSYSKALKNIVPLFASEGGLGGTTNTTKDSSRRQGAGAGRGSGKRKITADHNVTLFDAGNCRLGETLVDLVRDACGGGGGGKNADTSKNTNSSNTRFIELVLIELINQGCSISDWVDRELVDEYESSLLGGGSSSSKSQKNQAAATQQQQQKRSGGESSPSSAPSTAAAADNKSNAADTTRRKGDCYEDETGELHHVAPNYAGDGGMHDDDAAFAATIAASRAEAGLAPEGDVVEDDFIHGSNNNNTNASCEYQNLTPAVEMALAVLPHFTPKQIESALAYYDNNIEAFIMDATSDNLPPHLSAAPTKTGAATTTTAVTTSAVAASSSTKANTINATSASNGGGKSQYDDDDDEEDKIPEHLDMFSFLNEIDRVEQQQQDQQQQRATNAKAGGGGGRFTSSNVNYDEDFSAPNDDDADGVGGGLGLGDGMGNVVYSSTAYFGGFGINEMDSDLKHRTVMLAKAQHERLYEDERDDAIDEDDEANRFLAGKIKADESDDEDSEDEGGARRGGHVYFGRGDDDVDENMEGDDNENNTFVPAFNNRALGGPMRSGNNGGYQPKYTMKSTTFRVGGDSRNAAGAGKDPRDKKKEKKAAGSSAAGSGGGGGQSSGTSTRPEAGNSGASRGGKGAGDGRGPKGAKVNKSNISKLMKAGALF